LKLLSLAFQTSNFELQTFFIVWQMNKKVFNPCRVDNNSLQIKIAGAILLNLPAKAK